MTKILIVDDHLAFRQGLRLMLKELPQVEITEMTSAIQFIENLDKVFPDLVFMDNRMPGISGIEASKIALKQRPELRIIILTMFGEDFYIKEAMEAGVKGFTMKPPTLTILKEAYRTVMANNNYFPTI